MAMDERLKVEEVVDPTLRGKMPFPYVGPTCQSNEIVKF
jgi:hypothetical protein